MLLLLGWSAIAQDKFLYVDFRVYDPVYIGIEKGFFQKYGLTVELQGSVLGGPTAIQAVAAGRADGGLSSIMAIINANAAGHGIIGVADLQSAIGKQPLEEYFVRQDSKYKTIQDIRGAKFAVNLWKSSFHYTALMALEKAGMKETDIEFVLLPFDRQVQAIKQGSVDIVGLMEPYASMLKAQGGVRVLFNAFDVFGEKQFTLIFVRKSLVRENPERVKKFVAGIVDSIEWSKHNKDETKKIISKYTKVDAKYIPDYQFQERGQVIMKDVQFWIDYMAKRGDLKTPLKAEDIATTEFAR